MNDSAVRTVAHEPAGGTLSSARFREAYRTMVLVRALDERCLALQRQGRIGFYAPHAGQEATLIGSALALEPDDWVFPAYRELAVALVRGVPLGTIVDQLYGNARDVTRGRQMPNHFAFRDQHFVSVSSPIGTQITQAVGAAMAAQRRKAPIAAITYFGDGATSSNDFHAGLNFAGVFNAPVVFLCQNNQWAISLPRARQTRSSTLAEKAEAYGLPGVVVDGNDLRAVYATVRSARERAVGGLGPTLIESQVYRFGPHSTSDDPHRYRPDSEVEAARGRDPLHLAKQVLLGEGLLDEATDVKLWEEARAAIAAAVTSAEAVPPPDPSTLFDDVFAVVPPGLEAERRSLLAMLPPKGGSP
ncbi:MAG TPA: thiamine pyrophosphate-dependent dehydrogenase E1 component subunit alpha [Thermoplasmata archaeon]|nr:thiamine pyrophosphate-dependent dehydrogenase E1 component subunit alpha [Thermoplasmata archaeon]